MEFKGAHIHIALGGLVLLTYAACLPRAFKLPNGKMRAWGGIDGGVRTLYAASIALAAVAYLYAAYALSASVQANARAFAVFLVGACLWAPFVLLSMRASAGGPLRAWYSAAMVAALVMTSVGAGLLLRQAVGTGSKTVVAAAAFLLFHVLVLDNVVYAYKFINY